MALFNTIKEDREKLKGKPLKEKVGYFVDYYKWHVIVLVALVVFVGGTVYQKANTPEAYLTGVLFNANNLLAEEKIQGIIDGFCAEQELEPGKETILLHANLTYFEGEDNITTNYESMQILSAWILAGEVDFIIADASLMSQLADGGYLMELPVQDESSYLLDVSGSAALQAIYGNLSDDLTLGIAVSAENTERILAFIDYLEQ